MVSRNLDALGPAVESLLLSPALLAHMRAEVSAKAPQEACGLLAGQLQGRAYQALGLIPITNSLHSPTRYRMDPHEQLRAFMLIEALGWELLGIYHSHPDGPEGPSASDVAEAFYPECVYLIWSRPAGRWQARGFSIREQQVAPVALTLEPPISAT